MPNLDDIDLRWYLPAVILMTGLTILLCVSLAGADDTQKNLQIFSDTQIVNAIYRAENSKRYPYGILAHYKHTNARQACFNTIKSARRRFAKQTKEKDFIHFLSRTYCPIGAKNDPTGLNGNWERNVKKFLALNERKGEK